MTKALIYGLLTIGLLALAVDWTMAGFPQVGLALLVLIPLSLYLVYRKFSPTLDLVFTLTVLLAAVGLWLRLDLSLALLTVFCLLAAWDLDSFSRHLAFASPEDDPGSIERRHLLGVGLLLALAAGFSYLPFTVNIETSFERAVILIVFMFGGIGALVHWLRNREA